MAELRKEMESMHVKGPPSLVADPHIEALTEDVKKLKSSTVRGSTRAGSLPSGSVSMSLPDNKHANQATVSEPDVLHFSGTLTVLKTKAVEVITDEFNKCGVKEHEYTIMGKPKNNTFKVRFKNGAGHVTIKKTGNGRTSSSCEVTVKMLHTLSTTTEARCRFSKSVLRKPTFKYMFDNTTDPDHAQNITRSRQHHSRSTTNIVTVCVDDDAVGYKLNWNSMSSLDKAGLTKGGVGNKFQKIRES